MPALESKSESNLSIKNFLSSPEAQLAHLEIDSYMEERDSLRQLFETPSTRTRQEHASYLNGINQETRDLYERGAAIYGNTLIIPREANGSPEDSRDKVHIGSLPYAVEEFASFLEEEKAKEKATEFVELGKNIAGRTTDGDTLIVVFREFYNQIKRDDSRRTLSASERSERLDVVLERMRELSDAMLKEEWQRESVEILSLDDWERGIETRGRDVENEYNGRLTYRLGETLEYEFNGEREEERERINERTEELTRSGSSSALNASYERIRLNETLPQYPQNLSQEDDERLRYKIIPQIDRAIENGVRPSEIISSLSQKAKSDALKIRDAEVAGIFTERAPETNQEHPVTREEEARAFYTLQALGIIGNETIKEKGFSLQERSRAIDVVGTRLAQDYRETLGRLKTFSELETEREKLNLAAKEYADTQRTTTEFQTLLKTLREEKEVSFLSERNALIEGNNGRFKAEPSSNYSASFGEVRTPSQVIKQREANEQIENNLREQLQSLLINPEIEKAQYLNAERLTEITNYFSRITNQHITNEGEARAALAPELKQMRLALNHLAKERSTIKIERILGNEILPKPVYVGLPASKNGLRLTVENLNEYKTIERVASNLSINLETYKGRFGGAITDYSTLRDEELNFAREYVNYRLLDETTRLRNSSRLFREFSTRLNNAHSADELRETIKAIRQENYAREKYPERFANETEIIKRGNEQSRRPLNEIELKKLFLSLAPSHYTEEMRSLRYNFSLTKREKTERFKALENGTIKPSSILKTLLSEFDRTKSNNPIQTMRNIKSFLADYMNPPSSSSRNRFSNHNLFELRQKLSPEENNYLFKVIDGAKQSATSHTLTKQPEQGRKGHVQESKERLTGRLNTLRDEIEGRVSNYLISIVQTRGVGVLEQKNEGTHHAVMVSNIIKETFKENNLRLETLGLTEERISNVSSKLVGEIPQAFRERSKQIGNTLERQQLPITLENNSRLVADRSNREEMVRLKTQSAIEPIVNQRVNHEEKERTNEVVLNLSQNQVLSPTSTTMMNQPRPQDIAAKTQTQKENPYVLSR